MTLTYLTLPLWLATLGRPVRWLNAHPW